MKINRLINFIKVNWKIITILLLGIFFRFYRINHLATFLGEQGRDLLIAKQILSGKFTLLGPPTSISAVHFGPFYHYFNALFLFLFRYDPVGPAVGFALLSSLSIYLIYRIGVNFDKKFTGLLGALLYAISPQMIEQGKSMFNSSLIIFFSIISFWMLSEYLVKKKTIYLFLSGIFVGLSIQANFLCIGLLLSLGLFMFFQKIKIKKQLMYYLGFILAISPYLLFEARHQFFNTKAFFELSGKGGALKFSLSLFVKKVVQNYYTLIYYSAGLKSEVLTILFSTTIIIGTILILRKTKKLLLIYCVILILIGLIFRSFYPGEMLEHYLGSLYFCVFIIMAVIFRYLLSSKNKLLFIVLIIIYLCMNIKIDISDIEMKNGYNMPEDWTINDVERVGKIIREDYSSDYNIAALLDGDTRAYPYRYILDILGSKPLGVEEYPQSKILYVLIRGNEKQVLNYPVWEIYSFLPGKIIKEWPIKNNINLFKLEKI